MAFEAITTQEEFEARLKDRLEQKERSVRSQFEEEYGKQTNSLNELNSKLETANATIKELEEKLQNQEDMAKQLKGYELKDMKIKAAFEYGLPYDLVSRIQGDCEESIAEDAQKLAGYFKADPRPAPLKDSEPENVGEDSAYMALAKVL